MPSYPVNPNRYPGTRNTYPVSPKAYPSAPNSYPTGLDYPSVLPGVVMWLDGRQPKYQDIASTTPASNGQPVRRINLRVPVGQYASAASDSARPLAEGDALNFHTKDKLTVPASGSVPGNDMTYAIGFSLRNSWYGSLLELAATGFGLSLFVNGAASMFDFIYDSLGNAGITGHTVQPGASVAVVVRITPTAAKASVVVNGVRADYSTARANPATPIDSGGWQIPGRQVSTRETSGVINQLIMCSRAISDAETTAQLGWMATVPAITGFPTDTPLVIVTGDSIANSLDIPSRLDWWTVIMQESLCATSNINVLSSAWSGDTIGIQRALYPTTMRPFYSASRAKNIFVGAIGINNMRTGGQSAAAAWAEYASFLDLAKGDGFLPIACTVLPTTQVSAAVTDAFNSLVRANWVGKGYAALADVAADPGLDDPNDVAIYPDGLHPSAAGDALMAPIYAAAVDIART